MVVKSTNRSRNDSDFPLRLPHNPEVAGSSPVSATKILEASAVSGIFPARGNSHLLYPERPSRHFLLFRRSFPRFAFENLRQKRTRHRTIFNVPSGFPRKFMCIERNRGRNADAFLPRFGTYNSVCLRNCRHSRFSPLRRGRPLPACGYTPARGGRSACRPSTQGIPW